MPTVIFVDHLGQQRTVAAAEGGALIKLCDEADAPVPFHCRRGNCGTCRVVILEGGGELLPAAAHERGVLDIFGLPPPTYRLACLAQMRAGLDTLRLRPLGKRAPRPCSLWVPVSVDAGTRQMRACPSDTGALDISITGVSELAVGAVILATFHAPTEAAARSVVGRILRVEADGDGDGDAGLRRFMTAINFLEHDATLTSLFPAAAVE